MGEENIVSLGTLNKEYELSEMQKKLYLHHRMYPNDTAYNLSFLYKIEGNLDLDKLKHSVEYVLNSTPLLNVYFEERYRLPVEILKERNPYIIEILDYGLEKQYEKKIKSYIEDWQNTLINLSKWPLYKAAIFIAPEGKYYLAICAPHIISDGYSYYTFLNEIEEIYNSDIYPPEKKSFFEVNKLNVRNPEKAKSFFTEHLKNIESLTLKEIEHTRDFEGRIRGANTSFSIGKKLTNEVRNFVSNQNISEFTFFLACYSLFLKKITGKDNFVVGIPLPNRQDRDSRGVFGYFVNTLPLHIHCPSDKNFRDLCKEIKTNMISLIKYQGFNLSEISYQEISGNEGEGFASINNGFTYYKQELKLNLMNCKIERVPLSIKYLKFPFTINIEDGEEEIYVNVEYADMFQYVSFKENFQNIILSIIKNPNLSLKDILLLNPEEVEKINKMVNSDITNPSDNKTVPEIFEKTCRIHPNKIAVKCGNKSLTYQELNQLVNKIAYYLEENLDPNQKYIMISQQKSEILIATILGVLKSGRTYIPIDPSAPAQRIHYITSLLDKAVCITDQELPVDFQGELLYVDDLLNTQQGIINSVKVKKDDIAYIIFTSGSTGNPKGVQVSHENITRLFESTKGKFNFSSDDVWTLFHSYAFDFSVWEIFGALLFGGKLVIVPDQISKSPTDFYELIEKEKVTVLNQTPSAFKQLIRIDSEQITGDHLSLKYIIFGGEKLDFSILKPWIDKNHMKIKLVNMYGITETTVHVTFYEITKEDILGKAKSIIGKPIDDLSLFIVNKDLQMLPVGVPGEILVSGKGVSKGYYGRPDLTKERFLELPLSDERVYRTGDLGRYLPDGNIEYINRIDKQIQLRGYRIELEEIEKAINSLEICKESVVSVHEFAEGDKRLIAYIVSEGELDIFKIRNELSGKIPAYMIPSHILKIDEVPLTINGKVDYKLLPSLGVNHYPHSNEKMTRTETLILETWIKVVKNKNITLNDNFFDIGGTSLHVTEIYYDILEKLKLENLRIIDLFQYTTVKKLASYIDSLGLTATEVNNKEISNKTDKNMRYQRRRNALKKRGNEL